VVGDGVECRERGRLGGGLRGRLGELGGLEDSKKYNIYFKFKLK